MIRAFVLSLIAWAGLFLFARALLGGPVPPGYAQLGVRCATIQQSVFGVAWSSILLAQIHQESAWRAHVCSPYACGLTQFTRSTEAGVEASLGVYGDIFDPDHACLLQATLMKQLAQTLAPKMDGFIGQWAFTLRGYNGSPATLLREWRACGQPRLWMAVEPCRARRPEHHRENTEYPHRIVRHWASIYWWLWEGA